MNLWQMFENGRMIWLERRLGDHCPVAGVLYTDCTVQTKTPKNAD